MSYRDKFTTRIRRAKSWLDCARREHASGDLSSGQWDVAFVLYWIAFNAAFATEYSESPSTSKEFRHCVAQIVCLESGRDICVQVQNRLADPVDRVLKNKYLFKKYWDYANGKRGNENWEQSLRDQLESVRKAIAEPSEARSKTFLRILFERLYTLRNQIVHGGATWKSRYNRKSVEYGVPIMAFLVPLFVKIIEQHPEVKWGRPYYRPGLQGKTNPE